MQARSAAFRRARMAATSVLQSSIISALRPACRAAVYHVTLYSALLAATPAMACVHVGSDSGRRECSRGAASAGIRSERMLSRRRTPGLGLHLSVVSRLRACACDDVNRPYEGLAVAVSNSITHRRTGFDRRCAPRCRSAVEAYQLAIVLQRHTSRRPAACPLYVGERHSAIGRACSTPRCPWTSRSTVARNRDSRSSRSTRWRRASRRASSRSWR